MTTSRRCAAPPPHHIGQSWQQQSGPGRAQVEEVLYRECAELIQRATGCDEVRVMQHQYRNGERDGPLKHLPTVRRPSPMPGDPPITVDHSAGFWWL